MSAFRHHRSVFRLQPPRQTARQSAPQRIAAPILPSIAVSRLPPDNLAPMSFPLGKPILVMIAVAALTGVAVVLRPAPPPSDLVVWVFADPHARDYRNLCRSSHSPFPSQVSIETVPTLPLNMRLTSLFNTDPTGARPPDVVEIEIASIPRYFRAPADEVGFLPLNDYLSHSGYRTIPSLDAPGQPGWNARLVPRGPPPGPSSRASTSASDSAPDTRIYTYDRASSRWL